MPLFNADEVASGPIGCPFSVPYTLESAAVERPVWVMQGQPYLKWVACHVDELACYDCALGDGERCIWVHGRGAEEGTSCMPKFRTNLRVSAEMTAQPRVAPINNFVQLNTGA